VALEQTANAFLATVVAPFHTVVRGFTPTASQLEQCLFGPKGILLFSQRAQIDRLSFVLPSKKLFRAAPLFGVDRMRHRIACSRSLAPNDYFH
jgi:hypothetical protein